MDATIRRRLLLVMACVGASIGVFSDSTGDSFPEPRETLRAVGLRLSRHCSERGLAAIASRGAAIVDRLTPAERMALGQGYLRFTARQPVVVDVAVPDASVPFWLADQRFRAMSLSLKNADSNWRFFRRTFDRGRIGLGVNGLDRSPVGHYVVFVRPLAGWTRDPDRWIVDLDTRDAEWWRAVVAQPGTSAAWDARKPFEALPGELLDAVLLQPAHNRRHATVLATGAVWKTRVVSSAQPDQVVISFGADPARELAWTWRTARDVERGAIRIVPAPSDHSRSTAMGPFDSTGTAVRVVQADSSCIETPSVLNDPLIRRHRAVVGGLQPHHEYDYSLGDGTPRGWGPWNRVKTAPERGQAVRFLYLGDAQTGLKHWGELLEKATRRHQGIDFILLAGDLVDRGNERTNWDHFFLRAAPVFRHVPVMPCVGNHEYLDAGPCLYRAFFELPHNGPRGSDPDLVYSFESGDACLAALDSTIAVFDPDAARRQARWLDETLERTRATWKLVMFHHPVYPSHPWRDTPALREHWVPIFDKHHVDLVLQGHDHAYLRTYPLRGHRRASGPSEGTIYVIAVSGDKFVDQARRDYVEVGLQRVSTYQTIEVDAANGCLTFRAWTEDGRVVDELKLEKIVRSLTAGRQRPDPR
jgi:3',5'-cyclic AMP phosphodiesterase CpdA